MGLTLTHIRAFPSLRAAVAGKTRVGCLASTCCATYKCPQWRVDVYRHVTRCVKETLQRPGLFLGSTCDMEGSLQTGTALRNCDADIGEAWAAQLGPEELGSRRQGRCGARRRDRCCTPMRCSPHGAAQGTSHVHWPLLQCFPSSIPNGDLLSFNACAHAVVRNTGEDPVTRQDRVAIMAALKPALEGLKVRSTFGSIPLFSRVAQPQPLHSKPRMVGGLGRARAAPRRCYVLEPAAPAEQVAGHTRRAHTCLAHALPWLEFMILHASRYLQCALQDLMLCTHTATAYFPFAESPASTPLAHRGRPAQGAQHGRKGTRPMLTACACICAQAELTLSPEALASLGGDPAHGHLSFDLHFGYATTGAPVTARRPPDAPQPFISGPGAAAAADAVVLLKLLQANPQWVRGLRAMGRGIGRRCCTLEQHAN